MAGAAAACRLHVARHAARAHRAARVLAQQRLAPRWRCFALAGGACCAAAAARGCAGHGGVACAERSDGQVSVLRRHVTADGFVHVRGVHRRLRRVGHVQGHCVRHRYRGAQELLLQHGHAVRAGQHGGCRIRLEQLHEELPERRGRAGQRRLRHGLLRHAAVSEWLHFGSLRQVIVWAAGQPADDDVHRRGVHAGRRVHGHALRQLHQRVVAVARGAQLQPLPPGRRRAGHLRRADHQQLLSRLHVHRHGAARRLGGAPVVHHRRRQPRLPLRAASAGAQRNGVHAPRRGHVCNRLLGRAGFVRRQLGMGVAVPQRQCGHQLRRAV
jgi:hypothetical protein